MLRATNQFGSFGSNRKHQIQNGSYLHGNWGKNMTQKVIPMRLPDGQMYLPRKFAPQAGARYDPPRKTG
jgi:hypothetical protein